MNERFIKQNLLVIIFIGTLIIGITVAYWVMEDRRIDKKILNTEFSGPVQSVSYDAKQFPTITIRNFEYYIGAGYETNHQIEVGDSIIKKRGSFTYKLIKRTGKKEIEFNR
ncbi:hypothetical protein ACFJIV_11680 [Mucilaginibacter sp. UC70_90]